MDLRSLLALAVLLALAESSSAQSALIGSVADSATGTPLAGVSISLPDRALSVLSDSAGFFRVDGVESGRYAVYIESPGYRTWAHNVTMTVQAGHDIDLGFIALVPSAETARLIGVVRDSATGQPIAQATVSVPRLGLTVATNDSGAFSVPGVLSGQHALFVRQIGYQAWAMQFELTITQPTTVNFGEIALAATDAIELDPLTVEGWEDVGNTIMAPFFHRMRTETGTFITAADVDRLRPNDASDLMRRVVGFDTMGGGVISSGRGTMSMSNAFGLCEALYFIDGIRASAGTVNVVIPSNIAGMEIYRGSASTPQIFRGHGNAQCGVIAIWTKDATVGRE